MNLVLTAGLASRMGDRAPAGCKALADVDGRPAIEHHLDLLGSATIVCRRPHVEKLRRYGPTVVDDSLGGPASALCAALRVERQDGPVTVLYADTLVAELPKAKAWCLVARTSEDRQWDLWADGVVVPGRPSGSQLVCVGAYRFPDASELALAAEDLLAVQRPAGLGPLVNHLRVPPCPTDSWRNVT